MKEGALLTLNLSQPSANATNDPSTSAIEKKEEYSYLQVQLPQSKPSNVYKHFDHFKQRIESLALNKLWEVKDLRIKPWGTLTLIAHSQHVSSHLKQLKEHKMKQLARYSIKL